LIRAATTILGCLFLAGCVPALREPPSLAEMAGGETGDAAEGREEGLAEAERLLRQADVGSMRKAANSFLRAAAGGAGPDALVGAVRAQVWLAGHDEDAAAREKAATGAVDAAQWCGRVDPGSATCDYWLAVSLGVQARERRGTALDALPRIVELLERAAAAEPGLDEAGPHRVLALVFLRAPGWPSGPGDPERGLEEARQAVALRPGHPPNQLCLGEALDKAGEPEAAREAYRKAALLAEEHLQAGERDAPEWLEQAEQALGGR
jgi:tetratricopeptide (TPR) repeat protein